MTRIVANQCVVLTVNIMCVPLSYRDNSVCSVNVSIFYAFHNYVYTYIAM